jgi:hypothetical protein
MNLTNGTVVNLAEQATTQFNIQAITIDGTVGSVRFGYNGEPNFRIESLPPYSFCGDGSPTGNYYTCEVLIVGQHNVSATTFSNTKATGTEGTSASISFKITNSPIAPPTKAPTKSPTKAPTKTATKAPTKSPAKAPTKPPTKAPTKPPTKAPTKAPTKTPTKAPLMAPVPSPALAPQPFAQNCTIPKVRRIDLGTTAKLLLLPYLIYSFFQFIDSGWQNYAPNYPLRIGEPQGLIIGDDMIIIAGFTDYYTTVTNHTYAREITDNDSLWRRMDDMPMELGITHTALAHKGSKAYICGGYMGPHPGPHVPYCFVYDHAVEPGSGQQWTRFQDLPNNGTGGAGMVYNTARNALFYAGGGQRLIPGDTHPVDRNDAWKYMLDNPTAGWVATTPIPYFANHLSAVTHTDSMGRERHFFAGGQSQEFEAQGNSQDNFEFVAASETWVRRKNMTIARSHSTASTRAFGCGFIMAGGSTNSANTTKNRTNDVSYYDIPTDTWTSIGILNYSIATPVVDIHPNGYMHFVAGTTRSQRRRISAK